MPKDSSSDTSFAELINSARQQPPRMSEETEIPSLFSPPEEKPPEDSYVVKELEKDKPGRQVRLVSFTRTFVLWRPWQKCSRCNDMLKNGEMELPSIGDITCPHVQADEYKEIKDAILRGDGIKEFEEHFQLHDGTRCVQFSWLEADPEFLQELKERTKKKKDAVYPPDPEGVFSSTEKDEGVSEDESSETPS